MLCPHCRNTISDHQISLLKQNYIVYCHSCGKELHPELLQSASSFNPLKKESNQYIQSIIPPPLTGRYGYFQRMNLTTIVFGIIHTLIICLVVLMNLIPNIANDNVEGFWKNIINQLIPILIGCAIVIYDYFYASRKIINRDLKNFGIDFIFYGLIASIFAYFVGIYLLIKGIIVMLIAITDSAVFSWRYKKKFSQVLSSFTSTFSSVLGFLILLLMNPYLKSVSDGMKNYFYVALVVLVADFLFFRLIIKKKPLSQTPMWIGILKLSFGVVASFYYAAGIILVIEGFFIVFIAIFKIDWNIQ